MRISRHGLLKDYGTQTLVKDTVNVQALNWESLENPQPGQNPLQLVIEMKAIDFSPGGSSYVYKICINPEEVALFFLSMPPSAIEGCLRSATVKDFANETVAELVKQLMLGVAARSSGKAAVPAKT